jgi:ribosomal-protein-alanine N-acetyltransferase
MGHESNAAAARNGAAAMAHKGAAAMAHKGTAALETERLALRRFAPGDAGAMFRNWASDPDVTEFLTWPPHATVAASAQVLAEWAGSYAKPDFYFWAIALKQSGEPIGSISVVEMDEKTAAAQIGYCIGKAWWRKGYTSEALRAVAKFLFEDVGMARVEARHDPRNPNSGKVMAKAGMKYEGTHRKAGRNNRGICDEAFYAILAEDYFASGAGRIAAIEPITPATRALATACIVREWQTSRIAIRGELIDCAEIDGFIALDESGSRAVGLATHIFRGDACEIVTLNSERPRAGLGTALVGRVKAAAVARGCKTLRLITSNDNLNAIGFYQKRGFELVGMNLGAIDRERATQKPEIPLIGQNGIPLRHEICFAMSLDGAASPG